MADLIDKVWAIDIGREGFTGFNAQHGLQVVTHTLCSSCGQGHNGHIRKLLLQNTKLLVVRPAGIHVCVIGTVTVMAIIIALLHNSAGVYVAITVRFWLVMDGKQQCCFTASCIFRLQPALWMRGHAHLAHEQI